MKHLSFPSNYLWSLQKYYLKYQFVCRNDCIVISMAKINILQKKTHLNLSLAQFKKVDFNNYKCMPPLPKNCTILGYFEPSVQQSSKGSDFWKYYNDQKTNSNKFTLQTHRINNWVRAPSTYIDVYSPLHKIHKLRRQILVDFGTFSLRP